jgi:hypothetical protein
MTSRKLAAMLVLAFATSAAGGSSRHDADVLSPAGSVSTCLRAR